MDDQDVPGHEALAVGMAMQAFLTENSRVARQLRALGEALEEGDLSPPRRGVLMELEHSGPRTVPELAKERACTRQYVQQVINELEVAKLVEFLPNPNHQRSNRVQLTAEGRAAVQRFRERELAHLVALRTDINERELIAALDVLRRVRDLLRQSGAPQADGVRPNHNNQK